MTSDKKNKKKDPEVKLTWQQTLVVYLHEWSYLLLAVLLAFLLVFRVIVVSGSSMYDTLWDGDYILLLSNQFYHEPKAGDIVVISKESFDNGSPIVKRVIATEGQKVDIDFDEGIVYVDDVPLEEPYTNDPTSSSWGTIFPLTVEEGCLFVMGDNRNGSKDSRHPEIGLVDKREVLGEALILLVPGTSYGEHPRDWNRVGVVE